MANERDEDKLGQGQSEFGKDKQQTTGQQGQQNKSGQQQGQQPAGTELQPTMSDQDKQSGDGSFGGQGSTDELSGVAQGGAQSDTLSINQGSGGGSGASGETGGTSGEGVSSEGFIGTQGSGSDDYLRQSGSSSEATGGSDFADQGQGATEEDSDIETGEPSRSQSSDSDIEGSSGAA